MFVLTNSCICL